MTDKKRYHVFGMTALTAMTAFYVWDQKTQMRVAGSINEHAAETLAAALNEVETLKVALVNAACPLEVLLMGFRQGDERHSPELRADIENAVAGIRAVISSDAHAQPKAPA